MWGLSAVPATCVETHGYNAMLPTVVSAPAETADADMGCLMTR